MMLFKFISLSVFAGAVLLACNGPTTDVRKDVSTPTSVSSSISASKALEQIYAAIEAGDTESLTNLSEFPLHLRIQSVEKATDGHGFVAGTLEDQLVLNKDEMKLVLSKPIDIETASDDATKLEFDMLAEDELKGLQSKWHNLSIYTYLLYFGDTEHIVILGLDSETHKLRAMYFN